MYRFVLIWTFVVATMLHAPSVGAENIRVAVGRSLPPYVVEESSQGVELEIVRRALSLSGHTVQPVFVPLARVSEQLQYGLVDAAMTINEAMVLQDVCLTDDYITYQNVVVTLRPQGLDLQSVHDLGDVQMVAFQEATTYLGPDFGAAAERSQDYREFSDQERQVRLLFLGRTQAIVIDRYIFRYFRNALRGEEGVNVDQEVVVHELFLPSPYNMAFQDDSICEDFNAGLAQLRASGEYEAILRQAESILSQQ